METRDRVQMNVTGMKIVYNHFSELNMYCSDSRYCLVEYLVSSRLPTKSNKHSILLSVQFLLFVIQHHLPWGFLGDQSDLRTEKLWSEC